MNGNEFKKFREKNDLTQDEIAKILKVKSGRQYVSIVEKRDDIPHLFYLFYRYAHVFGIETAKKHFKDGFENAGERTE